MTSRSQRANCLRILSMDAVQRAKSGHPGAPMGMADIAEVLWHGHLQHNPANPNWWNRDRFVLSNGHGSMLIYALLHLSGYDVSMDDIKNFRQLHSKTPGHPEYGYTPGVETTTGPLGQGLANAVGFAIAEKNIAAEFNRPNLNIIDHFTYAFVGDGCLMEGISHEVCSLAGTLNLGKLIVFYDDNGISIDGEVDGWFTDDTAKRFESYGWQVLKTVDGHDADAIQEAIETAKAETSQPTLICCQTVIGKGSPNKGGKASSHGSPLGDEEIQATREVLGWSEPAFEIPADIKSDWDARKTGSEREAAWSELWTAYQKEHPEAATELARRLEGRLPADFEEQFQEHITAVREKQESIASRKASQNSLEALYPIVPELLGGSADLAGSNLTITSSSKGIDGKEQGNYLHYGVREFGMAAIMNGIKLYGGYIPYGGTFLIFMEYARNAVRMAALMKQQAIYVFTHDSIGLGEDGPTHQPVEQLTALRSTPNMNVWRPADTLETAVAWRAALRCQDGPTSLILSRQSLPYLALDDKQLAAAERGAYVLYDTPNTDLEMILIATGSEVALALEAAKQLAAAGRGVRVVSMPSTNTFDAQDADYRASVLPANITKRIAVEAAHTDYWYKYVGLDGDIVGMRSFGESAPAAALFEHFGITVENIVAKANKLLG